MHHARWLAAVAALTLLALPSPGAAADSTAKTAVRHGPPTPRPVLGLAGSYRNQKNTATITFQTLVGDFYYVTSTEGWEGVGILSGVEYEGVFRESSPGRSSGLGRHVIYVRDDGGLEVHVSWRDTPDEEHVERWPRARGNEQPARQPDPPQIVVPPQPDELPKFGEYVYVEELPEAIEKVPPSYPDAARNARIEGTVMLQALVMKDGTVGDTKVMKSVPGLDAAAVAAVRQWRFKPALAKGQPVQVWVAVPVKFSLH